MKFQVIGTVTVHVHKVFEADDMADAENQVECWRTWGVGSILDYMEIMEEESELDAPEIIKAKPRAESKRR